MLARGAGEANGFWQKSTRVRAALRAGKPGLAVRMRRLLLLLLLPLATSCSSLRFGKTKPAADTPPEAPAEILVGTIELVNPEQDFVLIRCEVIPVLPDRAELTAVGADGSESKLVLTPERKGRHLTADIREGSPQLRQLVIYQRSPSSAPASPAAPEAPATPAAPASPPMPGGLPSLPGLPPGYLPSPGS